MENNGVGSSYPADDDQEMDALWDAFDSHGAALKILCRNFDEL